MYNTASIFELAADNAFSGQSYGHKGLWVLAEGRICDKRFSTTAMPILGQTWVLLASSEPVKRW